MSKSEIGQWVGVATNVAVLVGVALLVFELRQNSDIARLELLEARRASIEQTESAFFDPDLSQVWVKSIMAPATMSLAEVRAMDAYLANNLMQALRIYDMEQAGLVDRGETVEWMEADFPFVFGSRFAKAWWKNQGQFWSPGLVEIARPVVESVDDNLLQERFGELQEMLGTIE